MKKGFTLIELLAVIVILAIIALIATPIILNIIEDARVESNKRSIDMYVNAIRNTIAKEYLNGKDKIEGTYKSTTLPFEVEYDGNVDCEIIDIYSDGNIYLEQCKVNNTLVNYKSGEKQEITKLCTYDVSSSIEKGNVGAKYKCNLGQTTNTQNLSFYILELGVNNQVTLILEDNYDDTSISSYEAISEKLNEIRSNWVKLTEEQINIPSATQIATVENKNYLDYPVIESSWLINGSSYWTSTGNIWYVDSSGFNHENSTPWESPGIRPVIIISTNDLK